MDIQEMYDQAGKIMEKQKDRQTSTRVLKGNKGKSGPIAKKPVAGTQPAGIAEPVQRAPKG